MSKVEAFSIIGGGKKENRVENDVYPTPVEVTHALMIFLANLGYSDLSIWEPACDIGGMSKIMEHYGHEVYSSDLRHTGYGTGGIDFLNARCSPNTYDAIITNPPFNLSKQFIEKSLSDVKIVAMVLKSQYWHAAKRFNLFKKHPPAYILPLTWRPDFSGGGNPTMDIIITIWIDGKHPAQFIPLEKPNLSQKKLF